MKALILLVSIAIAYSAPADWKPLFDGHTLNGWEVIGDGVWSVMSDGTLLGQRQPEKTEHQAWLYTKREFGEFELELQYWLPFGGNSGVSLRDPSRGQYSFGPAYNRNRTPSHIGYEIQLLNVPTDRYPSGSVYLFKAAPNGLQRDTDWNTIQIESRNDAIRVRLNGKAAAEYPGDPARAKTGPIGLQLHGDSGPVMFRNIRIRETVTAR